MDTSSKEQPTSLRIPAALLAQLRQRAKTNRRSLSAEILWRLERSIEQEQKEQSHGN